MKYNSFKKPITGGSTAACPGSALGMPVFMKLDSKGCVNISVHAKPGSKKCSCSVTEQAVEIAIDSPPVDGKANEGIQEYLAEVLQVRKNTITLISGAKSREKIFSLVGVTPDYILGKLRGA